MDDMQLMMDLHLYNNRQGPGSDTETLKALSFTDLILKSDLQIADIGCGTGDQTLTLATHLRGTITAIDIFPEFLEQLKKRARQQMLDYSIQTEQKSMDDMLFLPETLDLIWSEGAIYSMGFEKGIKAWQPYLKKGGYLAVSEVTWTSNSRPKEIEDFWVNDYPEINTASHKIKQLDENGFTLSGYFEVSEESWIKNYYEPLEKSYSAFLERQHNSDEAKQIVEMHKEEYDLYKKYKDYYSYGFYVARKD